MKKKKNLPARYFQYIDGDNKGKVVKLVGIDDYEGETIYDFDDGESMFKTFVSPMAKDKKSLDKKFMVEVKSSDPKYLWRFDTVKETRVDLGNMESTMAPPLEDIINADTTRDESGNFALKDSVLGKDRMLFPIDMEYETQELPEKDWMYDDEPEPVVETKEKEQVIEDAPKEEPKVEQVTTEIPVIVSGATQRKEVCQPDQDPLAPDYNEMTEDEKAIAVLVNRSKKNETEIQINITLGLPAKSLYEIADSNFENGGDLFIKEIVKSLTYEMIVDAVKQGLKESYSQE